MRDRVVLCVDEATCRNPGVIGLDGESLEFQEWLEVFTEGAEARRFLKERGGASEAWVVSCGDVDPINLAATVKADQPDLHVCLVSFDICGSLLSRASTALIDEVIDQAELVRRYGARKGAVMQAPQPVQERSLVQARTRRLQDEPPTRAFVLPVVSGSGGAGKSSVSVLGALLSREMGKRTLLLDCDFQFGDAAVMAGVQNPLHADEAIAHPDQLKRELARDGRFTVIAAPERLEAAEGVVRELPRLLDAMSDVFDVIVVNTGATWAEQHALLLERSSAALFLVDQRASSVRACNHALELCSRCGIATGPFQFALNRCSKTAPLTVADVSCALQGAPVFELKEGGRDVEDYLSGGEPMALIEQGNEFARSVERVMSRLLPGGNHQAARGGDSGSGKRARKRARHGERRMGRRRS